MVAFHRLFGICLMRALYTTGRGADLATAVPVKTLWNIFLIAKRAIIVNFLPDLSFVIDF